MIPFKDDFEDFRVTGRSGISRKNDDGDAAVCFLCSLCFVVSNRVGYRVFGNSGSSEMMGLILKRVVISVGIVSEG